MKEMSEIEALGFKLVNMDYDEGTNSTSYIFERKVEQDNVQQLTIEDHCWERDEPDFDPDKGDIGDWLIFSNLKKSETDWFGHKIDEPYPLTYTETKAIIRFIERMQYNKRGIL